MSALGFIETNGLLAAITAADAMLKAADVRLLEKHLATGGLVTISVAGEVSAVSAAVDAATMAIKDICPTALVSRHVIARPDSELSAIINTGSTPKQFLAAQTGGNSSSPAPVNANTAGKAKAANKNSTSATQGANSASTTGKAKTANPKQATAPKGSSAKTGAKAAAKKTTKPGKNKAAKQ